MTKRDKINFWLLIALIIGAIFFAHKVEAQNPPGIPFAPKITSSTALPALCNNGDINYNSTQYDWFTCGPVNHWSEFAAASGFVLSFNGRQGAVILTNADITAATTQALDPTASPTFVSETLTGAPPTTATGQVGYGGSVTAATNCGSLMGSTGCLPINVAGTARYIPFY